MKVAITGGSGKTGYRIAEESLKTGYETKIIVRKGSILNKSLEGRNIQRINFESNSELEDALKGNDCLIIATGARPSIDLLGPLKIDALNVINQIKCAESVGVKRIILVTNCLI